MLTATNTKRKPRPSVGAGRPRQFVPETALQRALDVFWRKGFKATSLDDLLAAMDLSKSSFYSCFGSKQTLYAEAIRAYSDQHFGALCAAAIAARDPMTGALAVIAKVANVEGGSEGCFFINTVTELAPHDQHITTYCQSHIARVTQLVTGLLEQAGLAPQLARDRAAIALALAMGLITLRKAGLQAEQLEKMLAQVAPLLVRP